MADKRTQGAERIRAAEVTGALCLATDLGMGFPFEHGLQTTLVATRLAERLGVDLATASQTFYASLLSHSGCTTDAHVTAEIFGDSLTTHLNPVMYGSGHEALSRADRGRASRALRRFQSAYRKIGVSTRAGATLFAMQHGLVAWGELPIPRPAVRS